MFFSIKLIGILLLCVGLCQIWLNNLLGCLIIGYKVKAKANKLQFFRRFFQVFNTRMILIFISNCFTVFLEICIIPAFWIVKEVCKETSFSSFLRNRFCNRDQIKTALFNVLLINLSWFAVTHALVLQEFIYL